MKFHLQTIRNTLLHRPRVLMVALAFSLAVLGAQPSTLAQNGDDDDDDVIAGGVAVDADGVLTQFIRSDASGQLAQHRIQQALASLDADIARPSKLRKVSLTRLARLVKQAIDEGHGPDEAMRHLAGLKRIQYVFYYPETQDIVLAGPAEGWMQTESGRVLGIHSLQPILLLEDLVVAMRAFPPGEDSNPLVYCSIDATQEGLARMQQFLSQIGRQIQPHHEQFIVEGLRESLGLQEITVGGIPAATHFAQVMVEADYRMKLIGIGLERPAARIQSYLSMASFASIARNALVRWWFVPDYQRIRVSEDGFAAEFVGNGVKLVGEDELVAKDGSLRQSGRQNRASNNFTKAFTAQYGTLAERDPVYGQLRNCIDMLVAAAFLQKYDLYSKANFDFSALGSEQVFPVETYNAPQYVATAVNSMWKGRQLATPVGGGVEIQALSALDSQNVATDEDGSLASTRSSIDLADLPADTWWWD